MSAAPQHLQALAAANQIRYGMADVKREIAALPAEDGLRRVADYLEDPPAVVQRMEVATLISSIERFGRTRTRKLLVSIEILAEKRRIGPDAGGSGNTYGHACLTTRQRRVIAAELRRVAGK